jgi:hypothetical protein
VESLFSKTGKDVKQDFQISLIFTFPAKGLGPVPKAKVFSSDRLESQGGLPPFRSV